MRGGRAGENAASQDLSKAPCNNRQRRIQTIGDLLFSGSCIIRRSIGVSRYGGGGEDVGCSITEVSLVCLENPRGE